MERLQAEREAALNDAREQAQRRIQSAKAEIERARQKAFLLRAGNVDSVTQTYTLGSPIDGEVLLRNITPGIEVQGQYSGGATQEPELLVSTYYDTPGRDLRAADLTLRVRAKGGRHVQTVKAGAGGVGLFDRAEWETEIAGESPDPAAWAGTAAEAVLRDADAPLERLFSTVVMRREIPVAQGSSRILVTLGAKRENTDSNTDSSADPLQALFITNSRTNIGYGSIRYRQSSHATLSLDVKREDRKTNVPIFNYVDTRGEHMEGAQRITAEGVVLKGRWWHPA